MRGIEKGQQVVVVIVDQVAKLIEKELEKRAVRLRLRFESEGV